jgi:hypothetical protein
MTSQEIEELAGHRQVPAWVVKLVADAVAIEREACAVICDRGDPMFKPALTQFDCAVYIRARGQHD